MPPLKTVGQPVARVESLAKVTGRARYAASFIPADSLRVGILRSTVAHGRIKRIDTSAAAALPGVHAVLTGADVPRILLGQQVKDHPILAHDVVRYIGDRVAAVAADDLETVERALALIDVEYEELPAVFDQMEAQQPSAPLLHPEFASYERPLKNTDPGQHNLQTHTWFELGDVERGFAESDVVVEHEFRTQPVHQGYIEPHCGTLRIAEDGRVHIWMADQAPYKVRHHLAHAAHIPEDSIILHPLHIGGSFGAKDDVTDAPLLYFLAKASGRPVTLLWTYTDELMYGTPRHPAVIKLKSGLKKDGRLWAREGTVTYNGGAYASIKPNPEGNMTGGLQLGGSYRIPNTKLESRCVYTNQAPGGYMRSPGEAQVHFAVETHMDMLADAIGMDPLEFRLLNAIQDGETTPNGLKLRDVRARDVLARAREVSHWDDPLPSGDGKLRARGIALGDRHTGTAKAATKLILEPDGSITLITVLADVGAGAHTVMMMIAAEELGVPPDSIRVVLSSTDDMPYDQGVKGMSATYSSGTSVQRCAQELIKVLKSRAAAEWGTNADAIDWQDGQARLCGDERRRMDLRQLARLNPEDPATASYLFVPEGHPDVLSFQAQVATVAVDPETGEVDVESLVSVHDVGRIVNPLMHLGQIQGSLTQGLGYALMEELVIEDGRIQAASLADYKLPTARDVPPLTVEYVSASIGPAPFEAKGIAESGLSTVAPALGNAVSRAIGQRLTSIPLTPEKVYRALHP